METIINLETGEVRQVDEGRLRELGMPCDFRLASDVTVEEWIQALQQAREDER